MAAEIRIPREEYEQRVLRKLRQELMEGEPFVEEGGRIKIEDVRLDTSGPLHKVHILFREVARPECLFGYWFEAVEWEKESEDPVVLDPQEGCWGPESWAGTMIVTNFEEQIDAAGFGIPSDCDPEIITWVNGHQRLPTDEV